MPICPRLYHLVRFVGNKLALDRVGRLWLADVGDADAPLGQHPGTVALLIKRSHPNNHSCLIKST
jgi:hypothetical protein